jgi:secondary thiamine-phosphate synthase enzyme
MEKKQASPEQLHGFRLLAQGKGQGLKAFTYSLALESIQAPEFIDITDQVARLVQEAGVQHGFVVVFSAHTTAAVRINENEPLLLQDMTRFLERVAPKDGQYQHNDFSIRTVNMTEDECPNGHAHCQQLVLGASETIPLVNGRLQLGQWQRLFLVELDHPRSREVLVQVLGV